MNQLIRPVLAPQKDVFLFQLDILRRANPFKPEYLNMYNPYNGSVILSEEDYDLYLREKAFHNCCETEARNITQSQIDEIHRKSTNRLKTYKAIFITISLLFFIILLPIASLVSKNDGYKEGYAAGVSSGLESGHSKGFDEGRASGYKEGVSAANQKQYEYGYAAGKNDGFIEASGASYNQGYEAGYKAGSGGRIYYSTEVFVTVSGEKYHRSTCSYLSHSKQETTLASAKATGYEPCSRCNPPE